MIPSPETIVKIRKLQRALLDIPERFNLTIWGAHSEYLMNPGNSDNSCLNNEFVEIFENQKPPCGTVGCLAGIFCIIENLVKPSYDDDEKEYLFPDNTAELAAKGLGISYEDAKNLFYLKDWYSGFGWPEEFAERLSQTTPGTIEYAQEAVARLEYYIETGK